MKKISGAGWGAITILGLAVIIASVINILHEPSHENDIKKIECAVILKAPLGGEYVTLIEIKTSQTCEESIVSIDDLKTVDVP